MKDQKILCPLRGQCSNPICASQGCINDTVQNTVKNSCGGQGCSLETTEEIIEFPYYKKTG